MKSVTCITIRASLTASGAPGHDELGLSGCQPESARNVSAITCVKVTVTVVNAMNLETGYEIIHYRFAGISGPGSGLCG